MSHNKGKFDTIYVPNTDEFKETWHGLQTVCNGEIKLDCSNVPLVFPNIIESRFQLRDVDNGRLINDAMDEDEEKENSPLNGWKMILAKEVRKFDPQAYTLYTYAALEIVAGAAAKGKTVDAKKLAEIVKDGTAWPTVIGPIAYDKKGDITRPDYVMYTWKKGADGKITYVQN